MPPLSSKSQRADRANASKIRLCGPPLLTPARALPLPTQCIINPDNGFRVLRRPPVFLDCCPFPKSVLDKTPRLPYNSTVAAQPEAFAARRRRGNPLPDALNAPSFSLRHSRFLVAQAEQTNSKTRPTPTRGQVAAAGRTASRRVVRGGRPGGEILLAGAARRAGRPRRGRRRP